ncbi:hypothetical protein [Calidifontibacter terrae]
MTSTADSTAWLEGQISPHQYADLLNEFVSVKSRMRRSIGLMILDEDDYLTQPMVIEDVPFPAPDPTLMLRQLGDLVEEDGCSVIAGYARPGGPELTPEDLRWQTYLAASFPGRLLGCYLLTPRCVRSYTDCSVAD